MPLTRLVLAVATLGHAVLIAPSGATAQERPDTLAPDSVVPLPGLTVPIGRLRVGAVPISATPFPVQTVTGAAAASRGIAGALDALPGVTLGSQTGSPAQSDVRIRGFAVSPIVGLPQSVSVFVDGVRVNEADASQVHLSLIPEGAIERVELIRGPVGAFGKNALAGAIHVVTARGSGAPFVEAESQRASFGSWAHSVRAGGQRGTLDAFASADLAREDGWRELERSEELSLFGKVGWRGERTDAWLSYTFEADSLEGPGPLPESWVSGGALPQDIVTPPDDRRRLQYTGGVGDAFRSRLHFVNSNVRRRLGDGLDLQATTFLRVADFRQANDNITEADALGITDITSYGSTLQLSHQPHDRLIVVAGTELVRNRVDIEILERPNRAFPDIPESTTELLRTDEDNVAGFAEAWWRLRPRLGVHASLRFDYTSLPVTDLLEPEDSGDNAFNELSGGIGLSGDLGAGLGAFAGFARGFRAPVILEVSCADPEDPCQLPFELGPDPPLEPVVSDSWQAGLRLDRTRVRAEWVGYWSEVRDDIFNVVDLETPTRGYFTNLDKTRRVGSELAVEGHPIGPLPGLSLGGTVAWTRATFESRATLSAPFVDDDDDEELPIAFQTTPGEQELEPPEVEPGDRFPMVPALSWSAQVAYRAGGGTDVAVELRRVGAQPLVGDESNDAPFDELDGYTLVDLRAEQPLGPRGALYLEIANLFDAEYDRFGIISGNVRGEGEEVERFLTPGRPRALRLGLRVRVD